MAEPPRHPPNLTTPQNDQQQHTSPPPFSPPPQLTPPPQPPSNVQSDVLPPERYESLPSPRKIKKISTSSTSSGSGRHPVFRGIRSRGDKWVSEIREPRKTKRIWLGTYPSPEMAAAAYDVAVLALKGKDGITLNFPDHVSKYPVPVSPSPEDIRRAAVGAALLMKPMSSSSEIQPSETSEISNTEVSRDEHHEFFDEEALFDIPNFLMDMAEGMLVSPPRMGSPMSDNSPESSDAENLWSYDRHPNRTP